MRLWASLVFVTLLAAFCSYGEAAPREANGVNYSNIIDILFKFGNIRELKKVMSRASEGIVTTKACDVCNAALQLLLDYLNSGKSIASLIKLLQGSCGFLKIATPDVCTGAVDLYKDEFLYIMKNLVAPPSEVCGIVMGPTCGPMTSSVHNWTVHLSDVPKPSRRTGRELTDSPNKLKVLHITDTHYDPEYMPGSNGDCQDPVCCRESNGKPATAQTKAGKWGYMGRCDIPLRTLESMLQHASKNHKIDMIFWTGDLPPHDPWKSKKEDTIENLRKTSALIRKYFPNTTVLPSIGNHESVPINTFPVPNKANYSVQWLYNEFSHHWMDFLPESTKTTIKRAAFYAVKLPNKLRVISLNTNLCYIYNWWLMYNSTDPKGQLQWLVNELQEAEDAGEKVFILGHVAPVKIECITVWSDNFRRIVSRYESTIAGQFYGHTHHDHFYLFYNTDSEVTRPTSVAYLGPSVTTFINTNPGYRIYEVDGGHTNASWTVMDHETYVMDVAEANESDKPEWKLEYRAKQHYGLESLSPQQWHDLSEKFRKDDALFQDYYRFMHKLPKVTECTGECKLKEICSIQSVTTNGLHDCMVEAGVVIA